MDPLCHPPGLATLCTRVTKKNLLGDIFRIHKSLSKDVRRKILEPHLRELFFASHFSTATIPAHSDIKHHDGGT